MSLHFRPTPTDQSGSVSSEVAPVEIILAEAVDGRPQLRLLDRHAGARLLLQRLQPGQLRVRIERGGLEAFERLQRLRMNAEQAQRMHAGRRAEHAGERGTGGGEVGYRLFMFARRIVARRAASRRCARLMKRACSSFRRIGDMTVEPVEHVAADAQRPLGEVAAAY